MPNQLSNDDKRALLQRYPPVLRYDSHEAFFADDVGEMLDNPDVHLVRGPDDDDPNAEIAAPGAGSDQLNTGFLQTPKYPTGASARDGDCLASVNRNYRDQAHRLHHRFANVAYGHTCAGKDGRLWLQYWFFYLYNDAQLGGRFGLHEGDWEMVEFRLAEAKLDSKPDLAVYAQHEFVEQRPWSDVTQTDVGAPVVLPGRGSHASYFEAGVYKPHLWDVADGDGQATEEEDGKSRLNLVFLDEASPGWLEWPGHWGGSHPRVPKLESDSPRGPAQHGQWNDPDSLLGKAHVVKTQDALEAERVHIVRRGQYPEIGFDFEGISEAEASPDRLVVTINSHQETTVPPATYTFVVDAAQRGTLLLRHHLDPKNDYDIRVSWLSAAGQPSEVHKRVLRSVPPIHPARWLVFVDRLWRRVAWTH